MQKKGTLFLFPQLLGVEASLRENFPPVIEERACVVDGLFAESEREGRRFLRHFLSVQEAQRVPIALVDKRFRGEDLPFFFSPLEKGELWGFVSDAGLPCLADPGAMFVAYARERGIDVVVHVGPSSMILALMYSGFPAQRFTFAGYLPREEGRRGEALRAMERRSREEGSTQMFMETPYRNGVAFEEALASLRGETVLCVAWDLTLPTQGVERACVEEWRERPRPSFEKKPAVFLLFSPK